MPTGIRRLQYGHFVPRTFAAHETWLLHLYPNFMSAARSAHDHIHLKCGLVKQKLSEVKIPNLQLGIPTTTFRD